MNKKMLLSVIFCLGLLAAAGICANAAIGDCAPGNATAADILAGKTADIDCDNFAEAGTLEFSGTPLVPTVGGAWLLMPGSSALGTRGFWVQKYEAKNVGSVPTSQPADASWLLVSPDRV